MKIFLIIAAAMALGSCESKNASVSASNTIPANGSAEASETSKRDAGVIVLDQIEQQKGHVVVEPVQAKDVACSAHCSWPANFQRRPDVARWRDRHRQNRGSAR